ncbi:MAG: FecR domain-containing protein [Proteobacteria bacterium]|nr:FecR domain-containing protein [Pseudomonadota bacterium]
MNTADIFKPRPLALAVAVAVGSLPATGFAAAGRVQFAFGQVSVQAASGASNPASKGLEVNAGDTIITEQGRVQLKFADGSLVSLQPRSTFKIDDYNYAGNDDGSERSFFSLFRGGLRTITGVIGHRNHGNYRVNTPVATIGIRGTEYLIMLDGTGAVVTVGDGAIAVINDAGEVTLVNGQSGVIVDKSTLVKVTDEAGVAAQPAEQGFARRSGRGAAPAGRRRFHRRRDRRQRRYRRHARQAHRRRCAGGAAGAAATTTTAASAPPTAAAPAADQARKR